MVNTVSRKRPVGIVHLQSDDLIKVISAPLKEGEYRESYSSPVAESRLALLTAPLIVREEVVGVVVAARRGTQPSISRADAELLMLYANTASLTVERAELYEKLHQDLENLEITDHITRLFTYRHGQHRVQKELVKSHEGSKHLSAIMMGVDKFKEYNDRFGQEVGDRSLSEIAEILRSSIRSTDFAFRYGGRVLMAVLPATEVKAAAEIAEDIQSRMRRHRFTGPDKAPDQVMTISGGVTDYRGAEPIPSSDDFLKILLALLHRAEAEGGDRILTA
jgi:diguanylate cyclase (GGDEF)-like protein